MRTGRDVVIGTLLGRASGSASARPLSYRSAAC